MMSEELDRDEQRTVEPRSGACSPYIANKTRLDPFGLAWSSRYRPTFHLERP